MPDQNHQKRTQSIPEFWDNYIKALEKQDIQLTFARWYVIRVEQYIQAYPEKRLAQHQRAEVDQYLHELGRKTMLKTWQFQQAVHAIQILFQHEINGVRVASDKALILRVKVPSHQLLDSDA